MTCQATTQKAQQQTPTAPLLSSGILQRKCASCGQHTYAGGECAECQKKRSPLQRRSSDRAEITEVPPIVHEVLRSPGQPLDPDTRDFMESRFGHDFSQVRVHTDTKAADSAQAVDALAYTVGRDVVFGADQYEPKMTEGKKLLAHELTHVVQQQSLPPSPELKISAAGNVLEKEADASATALLQNMPQLRVTNLARPLLLRQPAEQLRPTPPRPAPPVRRPPPLRVIEGGLSKATARSAERTGWRYFWRAVAKRFALRGAVAAALAAADGPLPIGELIDLGLALWTIWEIVQLWDIIWSEASQIQDREQQGESEAQAETQPQTQPQTQPMPDVDFDEDSRRGCRARAIAQRGGNSCHDQFATSISGVTREWEVQTPEGFYATFDALGRDRILYEIKTGYRFLLNTSPQTYQLRERTINRFIEQSENQLLVATRCNYPLTWVFNDSQVADFVDGFIQPPVRFQPFPCDEDR
ncbi:DUF4157 domain-containing protein [Gloeocapsopsis dulcis]|uniref:eCIS core domain-containing protein n=1 Tax=Gloeocapsopsis dulcis AAB1 = 1H9 TaxID=1433147 RepID=A0A6N8FNK3_9CHRO|nr:DUF4157 domain-containing protein [Gloeocapsopsis dulcis]MUL34943.1 hypothetical protein [Gloeocapsopsis dulcis AAB1 = 1H9]WNN89985.1 DUF4157 domain-containing protein [Gloeocapsopsis dulcis]